MLVEHTWAPQAAPTQPGTGSPSLWPHVGLAGRKLCLGGEEQKAATLQQVTPFLRAFLFSQSPFGQEVGFPETSAEELITAGWGSLDPHVTLKRSACPPKEDHCLQGFVTAANLLQTRVHLTQQSVSRRGQWQLGKSRKKAIIHDAAPNIAADPVLRSGDFLSLLWFVLVGNLPGPLLLVLVQSSPEFMETFSRDRAEASQTFHCSSHLLPSCVLEHVLACHL